MLRNAGPLSQLQQHHQALYHQHQHQPRKHRERQLSDASSSTTHLVPSPTVAGFGPPSPQVPSVVTTPKRATHRTAPVPSPSPSVPSTNIQHSSPPSTPSSRSRSPPSTANLFQPLPTPLHISMSSNVNGFSATPFLSSSPSTPSSGLPSPSFPSPPSSTSPIPIHSSQNHQSNETRARSPVISIAPQLPPIKSDEPFVVIPHTYPSPPSPRSADSMPSSPSSPFPKRNGMYATRSDGSASSQPHEDVLLRGDRIAAGLLLQGEMLHRVVGEDEEQLVDELEVIKKLGSGSYAVVYLVREVLYDDEFQDEEDYFGGGKMELDEKDYERTVSRRGRHAMDRWRDSKKSKSVSTRRRCVYGREFAVKVLSKRNLDTDALRAQMVEAKIHQSLPTHSNIVTLHRTFETQSMLLLVLEYVPGEDLFYFLEQARDHKNIEEHELASPLRPSAKARRQQGYSKDSESDGFDTETGNESTCDSIESGETTGSGGATPPTPSLLAALDSRTLLSRKRLRLVGSMFAQMCEAVAVCHDVGVYHRDIKPENFIVTDSIDADDRRVVVVKLTDFGLSTDESESGDMDCGSAPYMSYECRNNLAPTYSPRAADVWSLGIVLINMLYHINPWSDTTDNACDSFSAFRVGPVPFFLTRFAGMQREFAEFLANRVFCILSETDPLDRRGQRISARQLGRWVKDNLVDVMGRGKNEPALLETNVTNLFEEANRMQTPLSPAQPVPLPQQLNAVAGALADLPSSSPSPRWRHKRGLSNASSIGYPLSSVPQSRRPISRKASFSVGPGEGIGAPGLLASTSSNGPFGLVSRPASAAGSRATTPLMRGRPLVAALSTMSRAPSGSRELSTVYDHSIEEEDGEGFGMGLGLEVNAKVLQSSVTSGHGHHQSPSHRSPHQHHRQHQHSSHSQSHRHEERILEVVSDAELSAALAESEAGLSRSPSRSENRRRKRGARKGKTAQMQAQQQLISEMAKTLKEQNALIQNQQQQIDEVKQLLVKPKQHDPLESLANKSQNLARELSRTSRSASVSRLNQHGHRISPSHSQNGNSSSSSSLAPVPPALRRAVSDLLNGFPESEWEREASLNSSFTYTLPFAKGLPASVEVAHGPGFSRALSHADLEAEMQSSTGLPPSFPVLRSNSGSLANSAVPSFKSAMAVSTFSSSSSHSKAGPALVQTPAPILSVAPPSPSPTPTVSPTITKKPSKWKLTFGKSSVNSNSSRPVLPVSDEVMVIGSPDAEDAEERPHDTVSITSSEQSISVKSAKLRSAKAPANGALGPLPGSTPSLLSKNRAPPAAAANWGPFAYGYPERTERPPRRNASPNSSRTRLQKSKLSDTPSANSSKTSLQLTSNSSKISLQLPSNSSKTSLNALPSKPSGTPMHFGERETIMPIVNDNITSKNSTFTTGSGGNSKTNWRVSTSSASSSLTGSSASSAYSRHSNGSMRSLSTVATSNSSGSGSSNWRRDSTASQSSIASSSSPPPPNVKLMTGVPWELDQLPRQLHPKPAGDIFGGPPRKQRTKKHKDLPTINERPVPHGTNAKSPLSQRADVASNHSSTDLNSEARSSRDGGSLSLVRSSGSGGGDDGESIANLDGIGRVQKGQINSLAKMLSAWKGSK